MTSALQVREQWAADVDDWAGRHGHAVSWLDRSPRRPSLDLVAPSATAHRALAEWLDSRGWQWRIASPGSRVLGGALTGARLIWTAPGGARIAVHTPGALARTGSSALARRTREHGRGRAGLHAAPAELQLLLLLAQAGYRLAGQPELAEEARVLAAGCDLGRVREVARASGLATMVNAASAVLGERGAPAPRHGPAVREGAARLLRSRPALAARERLRPPVGCHFDGLELLAGHATFWPRPESEGLVHAASDALGRGHAGGPASVVDVGTGCGAVAVAVSTRYPAATVLATDVEAAALTWARRNARRHGRGVRVAQGSLLEPVPASWVGQVDVITANVPFVLRADFEAAADTGGVGYLGEGDDGLGLHRKLVERAGQVLRHGGLLAVQTDAAKAEGMRQIATDAGLVDVASSPSHSAVITVARRA